MRGPVLSRIDFRECSSASTDRSARTRDPAVFHSHSFILFEAVQVGIRPARRCHLNSGLKVQDPAAVTVPGVRSLVLAHQLSLVVLFWFRDLYSPPRAALTTPPLDCFEAGRKPRCSPTACAAIPRSSLRLPPPLGFSHPSLLAPGGAGHIA